ncbi:MAG: hypothetical protein ACREBG_14065 [Pyrinomonadaceae bacterium]
MKRKFLTIFTTIFLLQFFAPAVECQRKLKGVRYVRSLTAADKKLERAILRSVPDFPARNISEPEADDPDTWIRYLYNRADLNGDGKPETIAWVYGKRVSAATGCDALIFRSFKGEYRLIGHITDVWTPIIVSKRKSQGWKHLLVWVAGGGTLGHYVGVSFDGRSYSDADGSNVNWYKLEDESKIKGEAFVADEYSSGFKGIVLRKVLEMERK